MSKQKTKPVVRNGKKMAPIKVRKPKAPPVPTFRCNSCQGEFADRSHGKWLGVNPRWTCTPCAPKRRTAAEKPDGFEWFVLQVEPGRDRKVVKEIRKRLRIEGLEDRVKKIVVPTELREVITAEKGPVAASGRNPAAREAASDALGTAKELAGLERDDPTPDGEVPGYKIVVSRDPETGGFKWTVRSVPENPKLARKVVRAKKLPGYVLVHMLWDATVDAAVRKVRDQWGFLLRPLVSDLKTEVSQSQATGLWRWKVRSAETNEVLESGEDVIDKDAAWFKVKEAKAKLEEFRPTAVGTAEAAELLIAEKAVAQIVKDKTELNRVVAAVKVGDCVAIKTGHAFSGAACEVTAVDRKKKVVDLTTELFGVKVPIIGVASWLVELVSRPKPVKGESK